MCADISSTYLAALPTLPFTVLCIMLVFLDLESSSIACLLNLLSQPWTEWLMHWAGFTKSWYDIPLSLCETGSTYQHVHVQCQPQSLRELLGAYLRYMLSIKIIKATVKEINLLTCLAVSTVLHLIICIWLKRSGCSSARYLLPAWRESVSLYFSAASSLALTQCSHCSPWACQDRLAVVENDVTEWAGLLCHW